MADATTLLNLLLPLASITTLGVAVKIVRQSKTVTDTLATADHNDKVLNGDPKADVKDPIARRGLLDHILDRLEKNEKLAAANAASVDIQARQKKAILQGMGVSSDLSDPHDLRDAIKQRLAGGGRVAVDHLGAQQAFVRDGRSRPDEEEDNGDRPSRQPTLDPPHPINRQPKRLPSTRWRGEPQDNGDDDKDGE